MPLWQWVVDSIGVLLLLVLLYGLGLVVRRRWITRDGGTFELSHRVRSAPTRKAGRGWVLGLGRYSGDVLEFFRIFSLSPRPLRVLDRGDLDVRRAARRRSAPRRTRCTPATWSSRATARPGGSSWR